MHLALKYVKINSNYLNAICILQVQDSSQAIQILLLSWILANLLKQYLQKEMYV